MDKEKTELRKELEEKYGRMWDTDELTDEFVVEGFLAPFVTVRRKKDGASGSMQFTHMPRFYFGFKED